MEYVKLGSTDIKISRMGFGCWAIGGHGYGLVDDSDSIKAIHRALELGINFFDTADTYGFGHSEEVLSRALGNRIKDAVIATKFGVAWDKNGTTYRDCSPERVVEALEGSLRRLKIERIPIYQIHWHDHQTPINETMEALRRCQEAGKIRYVSCSNFSTGLIHEVFKTQRIESLQCLYNIIERLNEDDMIVCNRDLNMGVIAYGALARGLLSGKFNMENRQFGVHDTRSSSSMFKGAEFERNLLVVNRLREIATKYNKKVSQLAIRFILDQPFVTCALVGHKTVEHVNENVGAMGWNLHRDDINVINGNCVGVGSE